MPTEDLFILLAVLNVVSLLGIAAFFAIRWLVRWWRSDASVVAEEPVSTPVIVLLMVIGIIVFLVFTAVPGMLWWLAAGVIAAMAYGKRIAANQYAMLGLLAAAVDRSMPLDAAFRAFAEEHRGWMARRAFRLADLLADGTPLPDALRMVRGVVPRESLPLVRLGFETNALAPALRQVIEARAMREPIWNLLMPKVIYLVFLMWMGASVLIFIGIKIMPQFEKIFKDFGMGLPDSTQSLIEGVRFFGMYWYLFFPFVVAILIAIVYSTFRYIGLVRWDLPGTGWLVRRLDRAAVLDALSLAATQQEPIDRALLALAETYPKRAIGRRLFRTLSEVEAGADWCESLRRHGLLGPVDLAVLRAAARTGSLPWALREMADSNRRRFAYHAHALVQLLFPPTILFFGLTGMFVVVAVFIPLPQLILSLSR